MAGYIWEKGLKCKASNLLQLHGTETLVYHESTYGKF